MTVGLGWAVMVLWMISFGAEIYTKAILQLEPGYTTPLVVHGLIGTIVGATFTAHRKGTTEEDDDGDG